MSFLFTTIRLGEWKTGTSEKSMDINEEILKLDLNNLSETEKEWLHDLRNKAQKIKTVMFLKKIGCCQECADIKKGVV